VYVYLKEIKKIASDAIFIMSRCEKAKVTILPGSYTIHIHVVNIHKLGL